jgi:hypothetical protein
LLNLWYNSGYGKPEPDHKMKILVPVWPEPEVILKIPVPVKPTRIGITKFWFRFQLGIAVVAYPRRIDPQKWITSDLNNEHTLTSEVSWRHFSDS